MAEATAGSLRFSGCLEQFFWSMASSFEAGSGHASRTSPGNPIILGEMVLTLNVTLARTPTREEVSLGNWLRSYVAAGAPCSAARIADDSPVPRLR